jgi:hypothetical protein
VKDDLIRELAKVLNVAPEKIVPNLSFAEQSIAAEDLRKLSRILAKRFGREAPDLLWACATINTLAERFAESVAVDPVLQMGFMPGLPDAIYYE